MVDQLLQIVHEFDPGLEPKYNKFYVGLVKDGLPRILFCDNGSEFTSQAMDLWAYQNGVRIDFSRPGKPTDNAFVESFNGTLRGECLNAHWFGTLAARG
jgi:transposase InsO family protein